MIKYGDLVVNKESTFIADVSDASGNSPPVGYLWIRKLNKRCGKVIKMIIDDVFMDNNIEIEPLAEVVGLVNVFTGKVFDLEELDNIVKFNPFKNNDHIVLYHLEKYEKNRFLFWLKLLLLRR